MYIHCYCILRGRIKGTARAIFIIQHGTSKDCTAETVARETAQLNNPILEDGDDEDPFMDLDDDFGTEVEEDETVIDDE